MWSSDEVLADILRSIFPKVKDPPFECLRAQVDEAHTASSDLLREGFTNLLRGKEARNARGGVFIWRLDRPYVHMRGNGLHSTVTNIEKTDGTIAARWPPSKIKKLVANKRDPLPVTEPLDWQALADHNANLSFYSRIIDSRGPLRIWWASVGQMNAASGVEKSTSQWEACILRGYVQRYGCRPLKNRKRIRLPPRCS